MMRKAEDLFAGGAGLRKERDFQETFWGAGTYLSSSTRLGLTSEAPAGQEVSGYVQAYTEFPR